MQTEFAAADDCLPVLAATGGGDLAMLLAVLAVALLAAGALVLRGRRRARLALVAGFALLAVGAGVGLPAAPAIASDRSECVEESPAPIATTPTSATASASPSSTPVESATATPTPEPGSISGIMWQDGYRAEGYDRGEIDGVLGQDERLGASRVRFTLLHADGTPTGQTVTSDGGETYRFDGVAPGEYRVLVELIDRYGFGGPDLYGTNTDVGYSTVPGGASGFPYLADPSTAYLRLRGQDGAPLPIDGAAPEGDLGVPLANVTLWPDYRDARVLSATKQTVLAIAPGYAPTFELVAGDGTVLATWVDGLEQWLHEGELAPKPAAGDPSATTMAFDPETGLSDVIVVAPGAETSGLDVGVTFNSHS